MRNLLVATLLCTDAAVDADSVDSVAKHGALDQKNAVEKLKEFSHQSVRLLLPARKA